MPKKIEEKSALWIKDKVEPGFYNVGGVPGLHLQVESAERRSWILRVKIGDKRRDIGLGGYPAVTLAQAREDARAKRKAIKDDGVDPVLVRKQAREALIAAQAKEITFDQAAERFIAAKGAEWKNEKHRAQWLATLREYASPKIGDMHVAHVRQENILDVLQQPVEGGKTLWNSKTETASRVRGRIENVLDWARVAGFRHGENPARWRGHLDKLLAKPRKIAKVEHHPALAVEKVGRFMSELRQREGMAARALEFAVLTAARSGEVRGAAWTEIDLDKALWVIPGERMKAGREHRVPLSAPAVSLLRALPRMSESSLVFPGNVRDKESGALKQLSDMSLAAVVKRIGADCVPHGFRSTFRVWASERTSYPREVAEAALAHVNADKVEAAYMRSDLFEKRSRMMAEWAKYCAQVETSGAVVPLKKRKTA